ncbi:hypothetical protein C0992_010013, partial [Termitomyces sp. T32_za158]
NYEQDSWLGLSLEERSKYMARQGHAFATAQDVRVVYQPGEHAKEDELVDVPRDGKTLGEIVTQGNITMKEASPESLLSNCYHDVSLRSTLTTRRQRQRLSVEEHSGLETSLCGMQTAASR